MKQRGSKIKAKILKAVKNITTALITPPPPPPKPKRPCGGCWPGK